MNIFAFGEDSRVDHSAPDEDGVSRHAGSARVETHEENLAASVKKQIAGSSVHGAREAEVCCVTQDANRLRAIQRSFVRIDILLTAACGTGNAFRPVSGPGHPLHFLPGT